MRATLIVLAILLVQAVCVLFFVSDILFSVLGIYAHPIAWQTRDLLEVGAALGLVLGVVLGAVALHRLARERKQAVEKLRRASGAFIDLREERLDQWGLTTSERDAAFLPSRGCAPKRSPVCATLPKARSRRRPMPSTAKPVSAAARSC